MIIIQGDRRRWCGLVVESAGGSARLRESFLLNWPENFDPLQSPVKAGELLRQKLTAAGIGPQRAILCLTREDVILRHLDVPDVADEELPDLVRYQAAARSTQPLDQLLLDFLPFPKREGHAGRPVLAVTAPKPLVLGMQSIVEAAGCEPAAVTFSSIGLAEFASQWEAQHQIHQAVLAVTRDGSRVELVVLAGRQLLYAHSARLEPNAQPAGLLAEVSRTLVAAERLHPQLRIERAYLAEEIADVATLVEPLAERVGAPVEIFSPARLPGLELSPRSLSEITGAATVLAGLALAVSQRLTPEFDFLHPRLPPAKRDLRKVYLAAGSAAALLLATLIGGGIAGIHGSLQREIESLRQREAELDEKIKPGQTSLQAAKLVDEWLSGDVNQLGEFSVLRELMQGTDRMYLSQYTFTAGQGEVLGSLQSFGNAKSPEDVQHFSQRLIDTKEFRIHPRQLTQSGRDDEYPHRFELNADLLPKPKKGLTPTANPGS